MRHLHLLSLVVCLLFIRVAIADGSSEYSGSEYGGSEYGGSEYSGGSSSPSTSEPSESGSGDWPCVAGSYVSHSDGTCSRCPVGSYSTEGGHSSCTLCSAGTIAATSASLSCIPCAEGTYVSGNGNSYCSTCPAFSRTLISAATSIQQCQCYPGWIRTSDDFSQPCVPAGSSNEALVKSTTEESGAASSMTHLTIGGLFAWASIALFARFL